MLVNSTSPDALGPGGHGKPQVTVEVVEGPQSGRRFEFESHGTLIAGRAADAHLCLKDDPHFSRYHFRLEVNPPDVFLVDLGSLNGTVVNGQRVTQAALRNGDLISGGKTTVRLSCSAEAGKPAEGATAVYQHSTVIPSRSPQSSAGLFETTLASPTEPPLQTAMQIPGYELIGELGHGGMGAVYQARQVSTGKEVAVKVIVPANAADQAATKLFIREAGILSQLNHPRIVRFLELGLAAGQVFLAMEYIAAVDVESLLKNRPGEVRTRIITGIGCQVLKALAYAHGRSLIHRDIKPANLLVYADGPKVGVKLADFGLAKNYMTAGFSAFTGDAEARGTLAFMPPEQVMDSRYAKPESDIFGLGATLYRLFAGQGHLDLSGTRSPFTIVLNDTPVPLGKVCPDLPAPLASAIDRALARDPKDRFRTAEEMQTALLPFTKRSEESKRGRS
jgi:eukaryotic-like serine/threonine-protein kinase